MAETNAYFYGIDDFQIQSISFEEDGINSTIKVYFHGEQDPERVFYGDTIVAILDCTIRLVDYKWKLDNYEVESAKLIYPDDEEEIP